LILIFSYTIQRYERMGRNARDVNDRRWRLAHSMILYCLPGKVWELRFSYPGTSSRVTYASLVASSRRSCQTTVVLFNTETQRLQRFSSRGSLCLCGYTLGLLPRTPTIRSWSLPDATVAEGDTSSTDGRHRLSPAERATVGEREIDD